MPFHRRDVLKLGAAAAAGFTGGSFLSLGASAQAKPTINLQLGWLSSGNQIGEVCAKAMGFYDAEGIDLKIQAGGPNIDGVAVVAAGRFEMGQVSSSPSLMLAASVVAIEVARHTAHSIGQRRVATATGRRRLPARLRRADVQERI